jgi:UDP-glucose 4-epimerase
MAVRPPGPPVFNVCSGVSTSVEALARVIAQLAGKDLDVQMQPPRAGEIRHSLGVPTRGSSALSIEGRVPLNAGLSEVLAWLTGSAEYPTP